MSDTYRGPDRRVRATAVELGRAWRLAGVLLTLFLTVVASLTLGEESVLASGSLAALRATAMAVTAVLSITSIMTWRATGEVAALRVGVFAMALVATGLLDTAAVDTAVPSLLALRTGLSLAAAGFLASALWGPDVDTSTDVLREVGRAVVTALALWLAVLGLMALPGSWNEPPGLHATLAVPWFGLGVVGVLRAVDRNSYILAWVAWSALALGMAEAARALAGVHAGPWATSAAAMRLSGVSVAAIGATLGLARHVLRSRDDVFRLELVQRARDEAIRKEQAERAHEVRNALFSIEAATLTLNRYRDRLDAEDAEQLVAAVVSSIAQLRELVTPQRDETVVAPFRLFDVIRDQVLLARGQDLPILLEFACDENALVRGSRSATGQVLTNLFTNARRHGGAGQDAPVVVQVSEEPGTVTVRVIDSGEGIPEGFEEAIFEPGVRLNERCEGDGLGLAVARQVARTQGGDLLVEPSERGACFALVLTRVETDDLPTGVGVVPDETQDRGQVRK